MGDEDGGLVMVGVGGCSSRRNRRDGGTFVRVCAFDCLNETCKMRTTLVSLLS